MNALNNKAPIQMTTIIYSIEQVMCVGVINTFFFFLPSETIYMVIEDTVSQMNCWK